MFAVLIWRHEIASLICQTHTRLEFVPHTTSSSLFGLFASFSEMSVRQAVRVSGSASFCDIKMNAGVCTSLLGVSFRGGWCVCVLLHSWSPVDDAKRGNLRKRKREKNLLNRLIG